MLKRVQVGLLGMMCFALGLFLAHTLPTVGAQDKGAKASADTKAPKWMYGLDLKVRKGGVLDFEKTTQKYGIEVFRDDNNGNLIYISETGSIAVVPGK